MEKIVAQYVAALGPVATHIKGADITAFLTDVMDVVVLDDMFVARKEDAVVWAVVDMIVF